MRSAGLWASSACVTDNQRGVLHEDRPIGTEQRRTQQRQWRTRMSEVQERVHQSLLTPLSRVEQLRSQSRDRPSLRGVAAPPVVLRLLFACVCVSALPHGERVVVVVDGRTPRRGQRRGGHGAERGGRAEQGNSGRGAHSRHANVWGAVRMQSRRRASKRATAPLTAGVPVRSRQKAERLQLICERPTA